MLWPEGVVRQWPEGVVLWPEGVVRQPVGVVLVGVVRKWPVWEGYMSRQSAKIVGAPRFRAWAGIVGEPRPGSM